MILVVQSKFAAVAVGQLASGDGGVAQTVAAIQAIIDDATYGDDGERFRELAASIGETARTPHEFADLLWLYCSERVRFEADPPGVELVRHPSVMLDAIERDGQAFVDCDDLATFAATIIAAAGLRPVLVTVGRRRRGRFEHIFFGVRLAADRLDRASVYPLDPQERNPPGEWPQNTPRVQLWSVSPSPPDAIR